MKNNAGDCCMDEERLHIDLDSIPDFRREELAKWAIDLTRKMFSEPGAEERYRLWLKERAEKK